MTTTLGTVPDVPLPHRSRRCQGGRMSEISPTARALAGARDPAEPSGLHRRPARRAPRGDRPGGPALRRDPARGRHPGGVGARSVRRLPARPRAAAAAAGVQRRRGARPGDGGARRPARRGGQRRPRRVRPGQDHPRAARTTWDGRPRRCASTRAPYPTGGPGPTRQSRARWSRPWASSGRCASAIAARPGTATPSRSTRGRWWCATGGGTSCASPTTPTPCGPTGSTG